MLASCRLARSSLIGIHITSYFYFLLLLLISVFSQGAMPAAESLHLWKLNKTFMTTEAARLDRFIFDSSYSDHHNLNLAGIKRRMR